MQWILLEYSDQWNHDWPFILVHFGLQHGKWDVKCFPSTVGDTGSYGQQVEFASAAKIQVEDFTRRRCNRWSATFRDHYYMRISSELILMGRDNQDVIIDNQCNFVFLYTISDCLGVEDYICFLICDPRGEREREIELAVFNLNQNSWNLHPWQFLLSCPTAGPPKMMAFEATLDMVCRRFMLQIRRVRVEDCLYICIYRVQRTRSEFKNINIIFY